MTTSQNLRVVDIHQFQLYSQVCNKRTFISKSQWPWSAYFEVGLERKKCGPSIELITLIISLSVEYHTVSMISEGIFRLLLIQYLFVRGTLAEINDVT